MWPFLVKLLRRRRLFSTDSFRIELCQLTLIKHIAKKFLLKKTLRIIIIIASGIIIIDIILMNVLLFGMWYRISWIRGPWSFRRRLRQADMRIDSNPLPTPTVTLNVATADLRKLAEPRSTPRPKVELREHLDHKRQERAVKIRGKGSKEREYTLPSVRAQSHCSLHSL